MFTNKKLAEIGRQTGIAISSVPSTNMLAKIKFQKTSVVKAGTIYLEFLKFRYLLQESGPLFHCNIEITEV